MKEQLEQEKKAFEEATALLEKEIGIAQNTIFWNKKRIKLIERQLKEMLPPSDGEVLNEIAEGLV